MHTNEVFSEACFNNGCDDIVILLLLRCYSLLLITSGLKRIVSSKRELWNVSLFVVVDEPKDVIDCEVALERVLGRFVEVEYQQHWLRRCGSFGCLDFRKVLHSLHYWITQRIQEG